MTNFLGYSNFLSQFANLRTDWRTLEELKRNGCTVRQMMTLHILQYSYSLVTGFSTCVLLY